MLVVFLLPYVDSTFGGPIEIKTSTQIWKLTPPLWASGPLGLEQFPKGHAFWGQGHAVSSADA